MFCTCKCKKEPNSVVGRWKRLRYTLGMPVTLFIYCELCGHVNDHVKQLENETGSEKALKYGISVFLSA